MEQHIERNPTGSIPRTPAGEALAANYSRSFFDLMGPLSTGSAAKLVPMVLKLTECQSVIDVGCGDGAWLERFSALHVSDFLGVDGPHVDPGNLKIPPKNFVAWNLERPYTPPKRFDLALSLEVAEHLPEASAGTFVETLVACADAIVFSAAVPNQGGVNHVNEQPPEYWSSLFASKGYEAVDCFRPLIWNDQSVAAWYRQNMLLYARPDWLDKHGRLKAARERTDPQWLSFVHPDLLAYKQRLLEDSENLQAKTFTGLLRVQGRILRRVGPALVRALVRRLGRARTGGDACRKKGA